MRSPAIASSVSGRLDGRSLPSPRPTRRGSSPAASASRRSPRSRDVLRARHTTVKLYYGARRAAELFYLDMFERMGVELVLTTEDGSRGERGRVTVPLERDLKMRPADAAVMLYACGPEPMLAAVARLAAAYGRPSQVSVERVMGCGVGGCYSCVIPIQDSGRQAALRAFVPRGTGVPRKRDQLGRRMDLSVRIGTLTLEESAHRRERLLRVRHRVRRPGRSLVARRRRREGTVPRRARRPPAAAHRRDAGRHAECHRPAGHRRAPLHRGEDAGAAGPRRRGHREHLRHDAAGVRRARQDPLRRRRRRRARAEHLVPEHQGGRHHVRLQPPRHRGCRRRRARGDAAAGDPEADAQRHRHQRDRKGGGGRRRRCRLARQHVSRHGDRRRDEAAEALEHRRRPERTGDSADRRAHGVRVPPEDSHSDHRHGRHRDRRPMRSSSSSPARRRCRSARRTSPIRSSGRSCSTACAATASATAIKSIGDLVGTIDTSAREKEWISS